MFSIWVTMRVCGVVKINGAIDRGRVRNIAQDCTRLHKTARDTLHDKRETGSVSAVQVCMYECVVFVV
jgi:hypothetical protein